MCHLEISNILCHNSNCNTILNMGGNWEPVRCSTAENAGLEWGGCGSRGKDQPGTPVRALQRICDGCDQWSKDHSKEMYNNYGQHASKVREAEQKSDDERRVRDAEYRSGTPMPTDQGALLYGAGTGWSADQGGYGLGAPAMHFEPGMDVSAMPQELDLDDPGDGPSHSHVQGHNQRGDEGQYRRGGLGSGGWSQQ